MFKVGDIVRGKWNNGYFVLSEDLKKAEVTKADEREMSIKILEHTNDGMVGCNWTVTNNDDFELVTKPIEEELGHILKTLKGYMDKNNLEVVQGNGIMATTLNLVK